LFCIVDPRQQRLVLLDEIVDLRHQRSTSPFRLSALSESILSGGIPELESDGSDVLNATSLSHSAAGGE
jgi:hypothetical protein